jgi:hypothetical protein
LSQPSVASAQGGEIVSPVRRREEGGADESSAPMVPIDDHASFEAHLRAPLAVQR